jgi:DNA-binding NtrC family response regulator
MMIAGEHAAKVIIIVTKSGPVPGIENELKAHGITVQWVRSIEAAAALLASAHSGPLLMTELALRDGNWRDLVERVRSTGKAIPVVLLSLTRTADLWWDALECGVEDILQGPLSAFPLCEYIVKKLTDH